MKSCSATSRRPVKRTGAGSILPTALAVVLGFQLASAAPASDPECATHVAWSSKVSRGERHRLLARAEEEAVNELSKRAWQVGVYLERSEEERHVGGGSDREPVFTEDQKLWRTRMTKYELAPRFRGYEARQVGDKHHMEVVYCVPAAVFQEVQQSLESKREVLIETFRGRFAHVEDVIASGRPAEADEKLRSLTADVVAERAWAESYTPRGATTPVSFGAALEALRHEVRDTTAYVERCIMGAKESIVTGHLSQAERHLHEAETLDHGVRAAYVRRLHEDIAGLRKRRNELLREAGRMAEVGKFAAADRRIQDAAHIDTDDAGSLETARADIANHRVSFRTANPRISWALDLAFGSLGIDTAAVSSRVQESTGTPTQGGTPVGIRLEYRAALSRHVYLAAGVGWGFSAPNEGSAAYAEGKDLFDCAQASLGIGLKSVRKARSGSVFRVSVGPVYERASVQAPGLQDQSPSDDRVAWFGRASLEWSTFEIFVARGIGFEDHNPWPPTLIGWSDQWQVGVGFAF